MTIVLCAPLLQSTSSKRLYLMIRVFFEGKSIDYIEHMIAEHTL